MIVSFARGRIVQVVEQPEHTLVRHITTVSLASVGALKGSGEVETVADETQDVGRVPLRVYRDYVRAAFASRWGSVWSVIVLGVLLSAQASQLATNLSLRAWAGSFDGDGDETGRAARLYSAFALVSLLGMGVRLGLEVIVLTCRPALSSTLRARSSPVGSCTTSWSTVCLARASAGSTSYRSAASSIDSRATCRSSTCSWRSRFCSVCSRSSRASAYYSP